MDPMNQGSLTEIIESKATRALAARNTYKRSFDAAQFNRLTASWRVVDSGPSMELYNELSALRIRSRNLYENTPVISNYVSLLQMNVVGFNGFGFKSLVKGTKGQLNQKITKQIEEAWQDFCENHFDVSDQFSLLESLDQMIQSLAIDGEIILKKHYGVGKYGLQIELVHSERLILTQYEQYVMGIKRDQKGTPLSYCLTTHHPGEGMIAYQYEPADRIIHAFIPYQIGAPRGVPFAAASMSAIKMLADYQQAELVSARLEASKFIAITQEQPDDLDPDIAMENTLPGGKRKNECEPGEAIVLPPGVKMEYLNPTHPNVAFSEFVRSMQKNIAAGLGLSYNSLYSDVENTSYSSMRAAFIIERAFYRKLQTLFIKRILKPIFNAFIDMACASGELNLPPVMGSYDYYKAHSFTGKAFEFSDVQKEAEAQKLLIDMRLMSRTQACQERGVDYSDILTHIKAEEDLEKTLGIKMFILPKGTEIVPVPDGITQLPPTTPNPAK